MPLAPVLVTVYNRPQHLNKCIEALQGNALSAESTLYISSDGSRSADDLESVKEVRAFSKNITGFKKVVHNFYEKNVGRFQANKYIRQKILDTHGRIVFIEDDVVVSADYLDYINETLNFYENDKSIFGINGYMPPIEVPEDYPCDVWLSKRFVSWGHAVWKDRWDGIDITERADYGAVEKTPELKERLKEAGTTLLSLIFRDYLGVIAAGDARVNFHLAKNDMYMVAPVFSKVMNAGFDGSGEHCGTVTKFDVGLEKNYSGRLKADMEEEEMLTAALKKFYDLPEEFSPEKIMKAAIMQRDKNIRDVLEKYHDVKNELAGVKRGLFRRMADKLLGKGEKER